MMHWRSLAGRHAGLAQRHDGSAQRLGSKAPSLLDRQEMTTRKTRAANQDKESNYNTWTKHTRQM